MSFSDYLENKVLNHIFGKAAFTAPANIFVALSTADPLDDGSGMAEPAGGSYARVSTAAADWNSSSVGNTTNANVITFPKATASWGTLTHFALYDAASAGNLLGSGALTLAKAITTDDTPSYAAGQITISLD